MLIGDCRKFSSSVGSMSALILMAEARRSRIRAATSAVKRPAWSRLANEARERAATTLTMAQTITSSSKEKPAAAALRELGAVEVVIGRFIFMDTFNAVRSRRRTQVHQSC